MTDSVNNLSGGLNLNADNATIGGDAVGRDKITVVSGDQVLGDKIVHEAPLPVVPALHQLPAPPADFVGREAELDAILKDLKRGAVITGIHGLGGIGKTTLALVIADRVKKDYRDAQFYLNLRGASDQPMSPAEALAHVIRAYYPDAKLPEAELQGLYCSVLDGQRALILLDDARDAAQIKRLLPPAACLLLITPRQHFTLPGLHATDLNTLSPDDARRLLLEIAPRLNSPLPSRAGVRAEATHRRHAEHYLSVLKQTVILYQQGSDGLTRGLALFDAEWPNIQAVQAWAVAHAAEDKAAAQLGSDYPNFGTYVLNLRQHPRERIQWTQAGLEGARLAHNRMAEGVHLGNAYAALGETRQALEFYEQHRDIARAIGDRRGEGNALWNMALALDKLGEREQAIACAAASLKIYEQIESPWAEKVRQTLAQWKGS